MPAPNHQPQEIVLAGQRLPLAVSGSESAFESEFVPSDPSDLLPKRWHLPFGYHGMGASLPTFPGGYDYGLGTDPGEQWDELAPGLLHTKLGLALDSQVITLDVATPKSEDSGFTQLGTWSNDAAIGTEAWVNPGNAATSNDSRATIATLTSGETSNYLRGANSGSAFSIPTDATVLGIAVEIEYQGNFVSAATSFNVRLVLAGAIATGTTRSFTIGGNVASDQFGTLGGATDLFGQVSITPATVNATNFGVTLHLVNGGISDAITIGVDRIRVRVYYGSTSKLLYAGGGNVLTKIRWALSASPTFTTVETKSFIHGINGTPVISDVLFLKGGDAAGDGFGLVAFGRTASLQQIDTLRAYDDDTYTLADGASGTAYGELLATALGLENTEALVWKSVGQNGENGGNFCRVHASSVIATTKNFTLLTNWTPRSDTGVPYQVGQYDTSITAMTRWGRSLLPGKPEGTFSFDQNAAAFETFITAAWAHPDNAKNTKAFGTGLLIPTAYDVAEYPSEADAYIGLSRLPSNLSPIQGRPTAMAHYGPDLFVTYYDGTDSYIVRLRRSAPGDPVPHPFVIHGLHKVAAYQITAMLVGSDSAGNTALFYACPSDTASKHDVCYVILDPPSLRRYADGGTWFSTRLGDPGKALFIDQQSYYGRNLSATAKYAVAVSWDDAAFTAYGSDSEIAANGRKVLTPTRGTNDNGVIAQVRLTCTNSTNTNKPTLRGITTTEEGAGGIVVDGRQQSTTTEKLTYRITLTENQETGRGGRYFTTPHTRLRAVEALRGTLVELVDIDHLGSTTAAKVYLDSVRYTRTRKNAERPAERIAIVELRRPLGD